MSTLPMTSSRPLPKLVGLGYRARSGKDTIAAFMAAGYPSYSKRAFAGPLKEAARIIFDWTEEHTDGALKEVVDPRWKFTPRWAMQRLGTEAVRNNIGEDTWIRNMQFRIEAHFKDFPEHYNIAVTDVRFKNEATLIKQLGGELWRVDRPGLPPPAHASEIEMSTWTDWDVIFNNDGTLADLEADVKRILTRR